MSNRLVILSDGTKDKKFRYIDYSFLHTVSNECYLCNNKKCKTWIIYDEKNSMGWKTCEDCQDHVEYCVSMVKKYDDIFSGNLFGFYRGQKFKIPRSNETVVNGVINDDFQDCYIDGDDICMKVRYEVEDGIIMKGVSMKQLLRLNSLEQRPLTEYNVHELEKLARELSTLSDDFNDADDYVYLMLNYVSTEIKEIV